MNILFIICDTLRADHLGCQGYFRDTSPNIDRIAKEGVLFEDFYDAGCPTGPAFASLYTGLYPIHHKIYRFLFPNTRPVDDMIFTMPEILRAMGYTTAGFDNLMNMMDRPKHCVRGYEFYINPGAYFPYHAFHEILAEDLNNRLLPWLKNYSHEKFFIFAHYWDPHGPYHQPEPYWSLFQHQKDLSDLEIQESAAGYKYVPGWGTLENITKDEQPIFYTQRFPSLATLADVYDGEIAYMDNAIGQVIDALETESLLEETLIIVTSDHGEQLCQHTSYGWSHQGLHDSVTHIPLIMRYPKRLPKRMRVKGFCQHIDILPTLLDLLDVKGEIPNIDGKSILPLLQNQQIRGTIFMEHTSAQRAIRTNEWLLLDDETIPRERSRELELYNTKEDPMQEVNLAKIENSKVQEMRETLRRWLKANLKEGERDPTIYAGESGWGYSQNMREYKVKTKEILEILGVNTSAKW